MIFRITAEDTTGKPVVFFYDNTTSHLTHEDGSPVDLSHIPDRFREIKEPTEYSTRKSRRLRVIKFQLGLLCNYSCSYCSQRYVPHKIVTNKKDIGPLMAKLRASWDGGNDGRGGGVQFQFWGGEPLVYWKTLKPLAERLHQEYPNATLWLPTNGSLLDTEKNQWLDDLGFAVSVSHDGPGQSIRGDDPLDIPEKRAAILDLFRRLHPKGRFSFNPVLSRKNTSRAALREFFINLTGVHDVQLGEGAFIDPYDSDGEAESLSGEEHVEFRRKAFGEIRSGRAHPKNNQIVDRKVTGFINSIVTKRPASSLGQKCGMDRPDRIAIDLKGNVLTCQNVSADAVAYNGKSHKIGEIDSIDDIVLNTTRHWSQREGCKECPVLHLCGGSCMFLEGDLWETACDNSFSDNIPFFSVAFEFLTGTIPIRIEGGRKDREFIWDYHNTPKRKVIPIKPV